jgi:hypothetical protein
MLFRILADLVIVLHFLFILFVLLGGLLLFSDRRWAWLHLPVASWGAIVELKGWICPLTPIENWCLRRAGFEIYQGNFIEHYLALVIYPPFLTPQIQVIFGISVIVLNLILYLLVFCKYRCNRRRRDH